MSYATPAQFAALGLPAAATADFAGDVQDFLDSAFSRVNTYLRGRYKLPIVSAPGELVTAECHLAAYDLLCVRGFDASGSADMAVKMRYDGAIRWLRDLAAGKVNLDLAADATPAENDGGPQIRSRSGTSSSVSCDPCGSDDFWG